MGCKCIGQRPIISRMHWFKGKILNKTKIVNVLGTEVLLTMFYIGSSPFPVLFKIRMVFFAKLNPNNFFYETYMCYTKFVTYHAIPSSLNQMGCHGPFMPTVNHPPIRVFFMFGFLVGQVSTFCSFVFLV
jgi:hypothetical protein